MKKKNCKVYLGKNISSLKFLKIILNEYGIEDDIIYNKYGKPYLKKNELFFNISNCDEYTVIAISPSEVGVDIQKIVLKNNIIDKVFTENEILKLKNADDFTVAWVKKESYLKYLGIGLSYGLKNVDTCNINNFIIRKVNNYYISIYCGEERYKVFFVNKIS